MITDNALKNYTTKIDPMRTAAEIDCILASNGATAIQKDIVNGQITALRFTVQTSLGIIPIQLPVNVEAVQAILKAMRQKKPAAWNKEPEFDKGFAVALYRGIERAKAVDLNEWREKQLQELNKQLPWLVQSYKKELENCQTRVKEISEKVGFNIMTYSFPNRDIHGNMYCISNFKTKDTVAIITVAGQNVRRIA